MDFRERKTENGKLKVESWCKLSMANSIMGQHLYHY